MMIRQCVLPVSLFVVLLGACARPRTPLPPPVPPAPIAEPPPPPPKCEALEEQCVSKSDTRAKIGATSWTIEPPEGWMFAQGADVVSVSDSAALVVTSYEKPTKPAKTAKPTAARDAALAAASEKIDVVLPKKLVWPKKPHKTSKVGALEVALYQFGGAKRNGEAGPLLVFTTPLATDRVILGAAFVAERDKSNADAAVLKAIESLAGSEPSDADAGTP